MSQIVLLVRKVKVICHNVSVLIHFYKILEEELFASYVFVLVVCKLPIVLETQAKVNIYGSHLARHVFLVLL